jgi:hypothetical protein
MESRVRTMTLQEAAAARVPIAGAVGAGAPADYRVYHAFGEWPILVGASGAWRGSDVAVHEGVRGYIVA